MEKIKDVLALAFIYVFYRVKWMDGENPGYYLL